MALPKQRGGPSYYLVLAPELRENKCGLGVTVRTSVIVAMLAVGALGGCASEAERAAEKFAPVKARYETNIGKQYWVALPPLKACGEPTTLVAGCDMLPLNTHLKIEDVVEGYTKAGTSIYHDNSPYYRIVQDDGRSGYADAMLFATATSEIDPAIAAAECKGRGQPRIGMTAKQLEATCWGKPGHINRRQTAKGTRDQYVYGSGRYVDLHNGVVTSIDIGGANERRAR